MNNAFVKVDYIKIDYISWVKFQTTRYFVANRDKYHLMNLNRIWLQSCDCKPNLVTSEYNYIEKINSST